MTAADHSLPPGFEPLQDYVQKWAVEGAAERLQRRLQSTGPERLAFYNDISSLFPDAIALLDQTPPQVYDPQQQRLMNLLLSFAHVALAVEVQGEDEDRQAQARQHMKITRASADR